MNLSPLLTRWASEEWRPLSHFEVKRILQECGAAVDRILNPHHTRRPPVRRKGGHKP